MDRNSRTVRFYSDFCSVSYQHYIENRRRRHAQSTSTLLSAGHSAKADMQSSLPDGVCSVVLSGYHRHLPFGRKIVVCFTQSKPHQPWKEGHQVAESLAVPGTFVAQWMLQRLISSGNINARKRHEAWYWPWRYVLFRDTGSSYSCCSYTDISIHPEETGKDIRSILRNGWIFHCSCSRLRKTGATWGEIKDITQRNVFCWRTDWVQFWRF